MAGILSGAGQCVPAETGSVRRLNLTESLIAEEKQLTERLNKVREVKAILEAQPEIQALLDKVTELQGSHY